MIQRAELVQATHTIHKEDAERLGKLFFMKVAGQLDEATFTACVEPILEKLSATIVSPASSQFAARVANNTAVKTIGQQASLKNTTNPKLQATTVANPAYKQPRQFFNKADFIPELTKTHAASLNMKGLSGSRDALGMFKGQLPM